MPSGNDKKNESLELEEVSNEKRHWIRLTRVCNNACLFCLDSEAHNSQSTSLEAVKNDLSAGIRAGAVRAILSGGEPTIHKDFIEIIKLAKLAGYQKIQTITNGRMFVYSEFLKKAVTAGLSELTFSVHGHTAELHDRLTGIPGAFDQAIAAIGNATSIPELVVNIDICVNKLNLGYLPEMVDFFIGLGVYEFDLLSVIPFGRAWENRKELFFEPSEAKERLNDVFRRIEGAGVHVWLNRFFPEYLEGIEYRIQDPIKMHSDMTGMKGSFADYLSGKKMPCAGERCQYCFMNKFCSFLFVSRRFPESASSSEPDKVIDSSNAENILKEIKEGRFDSENTVLGMANYAKLSEAAEKYIDLKDFFDQASLFGSTGLKVLNVPFCFYPEGRHLESGKVKTAKLELYGEENMLELVDEFIQNGYYVKSLRCRSCSRNGDCVGVHINYIRQYGFKTLSPL